MAVGNHTLPGDILETCTDGFMFCFGEWARDVTNYTFWTFGLLGFCFVILLATLSLGGKRAFGFASFVAISGSIFLATLTFIPWWIASAFILVGAIGLAGMVIGNE